MASCPQCGVPVNASARFCTRCGVRLASAGFRGSDGTSLLPGGIGPLPDGTPLQGGRYQIIGQLGEGGMGAVYLAKDMELFGRLCVIKQMRAFFASQTERRKAEEDFKREAEVLAQLNTPGHPRIPEVYSYFVEGGDQFLVMKYIEGESLEHRLERLAHPLSEAEVIRCTSAVADALVYLHSRKPRPVVHRDIKPSNIIIDPEDRVWLVDFGLARASTSAGARVMMAGGKTVAAGTPGYTPLEQWQMQAGPRSDVYALGATMHHLLTGQDPRDRFTSFPELNMELLKAFSQFRRLSEVRPDLSPALVDLVARCLDPDPRRRPDAQQLQIELDRLAPTGSKLFDTVRRWSPTLGEMIGTALATFVRMLFGQPAAPPPSPPLPRSLRSGMQGRRQGGARSGQARPFPPAVPPAAPLPSVGDAEPTAGTRPEGERQPFPCLYCRGQGITSKGKTCPICRGTGVW